MIFFSFVMTAYIYYGPVLGLYKDIDFTVNTLFKFVLADLGDDFTEMRKVDFWFTFWFFTIFMTAMQFILLNMFVAFIANSYGYVNSINQTTVSKEQLLQKKHWLNQLSDLMRGCCRACSKCRQSLRLKKQARDAMFKKGSKTSQKESN